MLKVLCVIPSRICSKRLPRKPLLPIRGKPMIQWTYENALRSNLLTDIIVATDCEEIAEVIRAIGGKVQLTDPELPTGSERVAYVAENFKEMDVIVNLQGDEPFITPQMLNDLLAPYLKGERPDMTTLAYPLELADLHNPGVVKVIRNLKGDAIYFSRAPIPYFRSQQNISMYHHIGLYAFTHNFLMTYKTLTQTPLELTESLEQLRVLEHGYSIRVCLTNEKTLEINTQEEYELAQTFPYTDTLQKVVS